MISIKKVEVTPIDRNIAKIVDSKATQDDKTKNTYSMRVIDNELDGKVDGQFLVNNYYSKTDIDEVQTSETYTFTDNVSGGTVDVILKRIGNIVDVRVYPTLPANETGMTTLATVIELPEWAEISETSSDRLITICEFCSSSGYTTTLDESGTYYIIAPSNIYYFAITKRPNGNYYFAFSFTQSTTTESETKLKSCNTNYLIY